MDPLHDLRIKLDDIDGDLVKKLVDRLKICDQIAEVKRDNRIPMMQPHRIDYVRKRCANLAGIHGVNQAFIEDIYALIIDEACRRQTEIIKAPVS